PRRWSGPPCRRRARARSRAAPPGSRHAPLPAATADLPAYRALRRQVPDFLEFCNTPERAAAATLPRRAPVAGHPPELAPTIASHGARAGRPALDPPDRPIEGGDRRSCRRPFTRRDRSPRRLVNVGN